MHQLVELGVLRHDHAAAGGHRLLDVLGVEVGTQPLLAFGRAHEHEPGGVGVDAGRRPPHGLVELAQQRLGHFLVGPRRVGVRVEEQLGQCVGGKGLGHGAAPQARKAASGPQKGLLDGRASRSASVAKIPTGLRTGPAATAPAADVTGTPA